MTQKILFLLPAVSIIALSSCGKAPDKETLEQFEKAKKLYAMNNNEEALKIFESVMDSNGLLNARIMAGKIYYFKGNYKKAEEYLQKAVSKEPRSINAMYWLALAKKKNKGDEKEVLGLLDTILELDSNNIDAHLEKATILDEQGKTELAIEECSQAAYESTKLSLVHFKLGIIYYKAEMTDKAKEEFAIAMALRPNDANLKKAIEIITLKK